MEYLIILFKKFHIFVYNIKVDVMLYSKEKKLAKYWRLKGKTMMWISEKLKISLYIIRKWLKNIKLNKRQKNILLKRSIKSILDRSHIKRKQRQEWQIIGNEMAKHGDKFYAFFLGLYSAEGSKGRNTLCMVNWDVEVLKIFVKGLKKYFKIKENEFSMRIYYRRGLSIKKIVDYWKMELNLKECKEANHYLIDEEISIKYKYGGCSLNVKNTEVVQKIFGGIKYLIKDRSNKWLY